MYVYDVFTCVYSHMKHLATQSETKFIKGFSLWEKTFLLLYTIDVYKNSDEAYNVMIFTN